MSRRPGPAGPTIDHDHGGAGEGGDDLNPTQVWLGERSSAPADADIPAGAVAFYAKDDDNIYKKPKGGSEAQVGGGGTGATEDSVFPIYNEDTTLDVSGNVTSATGVAFNDDGTKLYVVDGSGATIESFTLSTAYDVSSGSHTNSLDVSGQDGSPQGISFRENGERMYVAGDTNDSVFQYDLSTAFDISTATANGSFDVSSQETDIRGTEVVDSGTKMFISGTSGDVNGYDLSTDYDITTATFSQSFSDFDLPSAFRNDLAFGRDGTRLYGLDGALFQVEEVILGTAYDLSTAENYAIADISAVVSNLDGITFGANNGVMLTAGGTTVRQWEPGTGIFNPLRSNLDLAGQQLVNGNNSVLSFTGTSPRIHDADGQTGMVVGSEQIAFRDHRFFQWRWEVANNVDSSNATIDDASGTVIRADTSTNTVTLTLASSVATEGRFYRIKDVGGNAGTNAITINTEGSETIDGAASVSIGSNFGQVTVFSDGTNWFTV